MLNIKSILPIYEKYVQEYYNEDFSLDKCTKNQIINNLQNGYAFVKKVYKPKFTGECCCFNGTTLSSSKLMYIYIFEYAYQLQQGIMSVGENVVVPQNKSIEQNSIEIYILTLMTGDGNADF